MSDELAPPITAREVARRALDRVDKDRAWATPALDGELARAGLPDRDRRLASELVYGVLRHRARLDRALATHADLARTPPKVVTILRVAAYQILLLDRVPGYAAVDDAVDAAHAVGAKLGGFVNAVLRKLTAHGEPPLPALPADASMDAKLARLELAASLPRWILDELAAAVRETHRDLDARVARVAELATAFAQPAPIVARVNRRRATRDEVAAELAAAGVTATPIDVDPELAALRLEGLGDPSRDPGFAAGRWTVQDTGAQLVSLLALRGLGRSTAGLRILDACSGVGGKATHLAELTDDAAAVDAADISTTKLGLARDTAARLGLTSISPRACDLLDPAAPLAAAYDLVVLDAPCSGLGVLRRHPDAKWRLVARDVPRLAELQRMLLDAVLPRLAPGGTLVYSVCTFTRAEGPEQVAALIARAQAQGIALALVEQHRTWPPDADAFYLARLVRAHP